AVLRPAVPRADHGDGRDADRPPGARSAPVLPAPPAPRLQPVLHRHRAPEAHRALLRRARVRLQPGVDPRPGAGGDGTPNYGTAAPDHRSHPRHQRRRGPARAARELRRPGPPHPGRPAREGPGRQPRLQLRDARPLQPPRPGLPRDRFCMSPKSPPDAWVAMPSEAQVRAVLPPDADQPYDFGFLPAMFRLVMAHQGIAPFFGGLFGRIMFEPGA